MKEHITQPYGGGRGPLGVKGPTIKRSTGVDVRGMRPNHSAAVFGHGQCNVVPYLYMICIVWFIQRFVFMANFLLAFIH